MVLDKINFLLQWKVLFPYGTENSEAWRKLTILNTWFWKKLLKMVGVRSLLFLESPAAKTCRFLMFIDTDLYVSKSFPKDDFYHWTLCAHIFLANGWFYYSFYGYKTPLLKGNSKKKLWRKKVHEYTSFFLILVRQYCTMALPLLFGCFAEIWNI